MTKMKIELSIPSGLKEEPIIYIMSRDFKVVPNIIEASFSTSMGWAILTVEGEKEEIDKLLAFLRGRDIRVKVL